MKKKKIVFVMNNFWMGGTERFLLSLMSQLCGEYEIEVATVLGPGPLEPYFQKLSVRISHMSPVVFANKKLPFKAFWILAAPITLLRLVIFLFKVKPEVVITSLYQSDIIGMLAARIAGVKKRILVQHDVQEFGFFRKYFKFFFALRLSTHVVSVSETVRDFMTSYWSVPQSKNTVVCNGVSFADFDGASKSPPGGPVTLGIVGRLEPVKGHRILLDALNIIKKEYSLVPAVLVAGGGSLFSDLSGYAEALRLKNVEFLGPVMDPAAFFQKVDILVAPSLAEGFGLVVLEGLAAEKLVVASDIGPFKEIIHAGENGILFSKNDARDLAMTLKNILDDAKIVSLYQQKTALWKKTAGYKYDMRHVAVEYKKIIESA